MRINHEILGAIDSGLLLFVGFGHNDSVDDLVPMASKVVHLRVFPDEYGRFDRSLLDVGGAILLVPQFTLYANTRKGRRPDFSQAMAPTVGLDLFSKFISAVRNTGVRRLETGQFGADMQVELINDGPVTLLINNDQ